MIFRPERGYAGELDAADPLAGFRDRFVRDDESLLYLDGNSLGRLPRRRPCARGAAAGQAAGRARWEPRRFQSR